MVYWKEINVFLKFKNGLNKGEVEPFYDLCMKILICIENLKPKLPREEILYYATIQFAILYAIKCHL